MFLYASVGLHGRIQLPDEAVRILQLKPGDIINVKPHPRDPHACVIKKRIPGLVLVSQKTK